MPKQFDLEPHEYRPTGFRRAKRGINSKWMLRLSTIAGVWAATSLWLTRGGLVGQNIWLACAMAFFPALLLMMYAALTDPN